MKLTMKKGISHCYVIKTKDNKLAKAAKFYMHIYSNNKTWPKEMLFIQTSARNDCKRFPEINFKL